MPFDQPQSDTERAQAKVAVGIAAIVVFVAALVVAFIFVFFVMGGFSQSAPSAEFSADVVQNESNPDNVDIVVEHIGGETMDANNLELNGTQPQTNGTVMAGDEIVFTNLSDERDQYVLYWETDDGNMETGLVAIEMVNE